jgi:hypothetical protein
VGKEEGRQCLYPAEEDTTCVGLMEVEGNGPADIPGHAAAGTRKVGLSNRPHTTASYGAVRAHGQRLT